MEGVSVDSLLGLAVRRRHQGLRIRGQGRAPPLIGLRDL
jgi:hypothetical protein